MHRDRKPTLTRSPGPDQRRAHRRAELGAKQEVAVADEPLAPGVLDPARIRTLTNDPVLGKADRVDGDETRGVVAFTFDDGPNPETTPAVIDALEKYDIPATFFIVTRRLVGTQGAKPRELLDRILKAASRSAVTP